VKENCKGSDSIFTNKFIVTRILGHSELDKNIENWKEVDE
jgi:hypothetical protein